LGAEKPNQTEYFDLDRFWQGERRWKVKKRKSDICIICMFSFHYRKWGVLLGYYFVQAIQIFCSNLALQKSPRQNISIWLTLLLQIAHHTESPEKNVYCPGGRAHQLTCQTAREFIFYRTAFLQCCEHSKWKDQGVNFLTANGKDYIYTVDFDT
jgi:hypothetical protein